jgi:hypothetical protein
MSVKNTQNDINAEDYIVDLDGATEPYLTQPKRKYGEKVVKGIIVGRDPNKNIISIEEVRRLAALHLTYRDMSEFFGVKENTFRDHFKYEVERARQTTKQRLMEAMLENAVVKMNPTMQIWLSKNLLGFEDSPSNKEGVEVLPWIKE